MALYEEFGLRPILNAMGSMTSLGGSCMAPEVTAAMAEAAGSFIDLNGLALKAGEEVSREFARSSPPFDPDNA